MNDSSSEKMKALRELILAKAQSQRNDILDSARKEAEAFLKVEGEKIEREADIIVREARTRSEEMRRRQVTSAEREISMDKLRSQNNLMRDAMKMLEDELARSREKDEYPDILTGLAKEALLSLAGASEVRLRLAASDAPLGIRVSEKLCKIVASVRVVFDPAPAPILGGVWLATADGRRQATSDWSIKARELADALADRLAPLL